MDLIKFVTQFAGKRATPAFAPTDIASLRYWIKADTGLFQDAEGTTPATADGDVVGLWKDQSGNAYDVSQATTEKKPLLKLTTNGINNRAAVLFDGSNDILVRTVANWLSGDSAGSVFIVVQLDTIADLMAALATADEGGTAYYMMFNPYYQNDAAGRPLRVMQRNNDTGDFVRVDDILAVDTAYVAAYRSSGTAYTIRMNGVDRTLTVVAGSNTGDWFADTANRDNMSVGGVKRSAEAYFTNGLIAEIIAYGDNLTGDDLTNVETYLADRYGVELQYAITTSVDFDSGSADSVGVEL